VVATPASVLTVADLLDRCGPTRPRPGPRPAVDAPAATPLLGDGRPAGSVGDAELEEERAPGRGPSASVVERSAVAAAVLVVVGSVVGLALATPDAPAADTAAVDERTPGRAWPGRVHAVPGPGPAVATDALDPGAAPDDAWPEVAFPDSTDADRPAATGGRSTTAGDAPPQDRAGEPDGATPPTVGAGGDAWADDSDDSRDARSRGNGNGNGKGNGKGNGNGNGRGNGNGGGEDDEEPVGDRRSDARRDSS
jgi:uncharacterized membrane protein YgcG